MLLFLWLSAIVAIATACVDLLFVLDPKDEHSLGRAVKVASDIEHRELFTAVVTNRASRILTRKTKNTADLVSMLENVSGPYEKLLDAVTVEILRRRSERTLVILLFTEKEVNATLTNLWKEMKHTPVFVFRVGTAKAAKELFSTETVTFNKLIDCKIKVEMKDTDVRRRQPNEGLGTKLPTTVNVPRVEARSRNVSRKPGPVFKGTTSAIKASNDTTSQKLGNTQDRKTLNCDSSRPPMILLKPIFKGTTAKLTTTQGTTAVPRRIPPGTTHPALPKTTTTQRLVSQATTAPHRAPPSSLWQTHKVLSQTSRGLTSSTSRTTSTSRATTTPVTTTTRRVPPGCIADIVFLVDFSKGTGENSQSYFDIAASAVGVLPIGPDAVRVAMVGYSGPGRATTLFHLDKHESKDDLIEELFRKQSGGGTTRTAEALRFARAEFNSMKHGARKGTKKFIVLFSDGFSQDNQIEAAMEARRDGIQIITVSIGGILPPNEDELRLISGSKELVLIDPKGQQIREKILGRACAL